MTIIVGYLGPGGSYSEAVCQHLYPLAQHVDWQFVQFASLLEVMQAIENGDISLAVLPCENSKSGVLKDQQQHEFLARISAPHATLRILAEKFWPLEFILMGYTATHISRIKTVHVNPYAHEQCQLYLRQYPSWQIEKHTSSSAAAKAVHEQADTTHAAIASSCALREYQLTAVDAHIFHPGDEPVMHFIVLGEAHVATIHLPKEPFVSSFAVHTSPSILFNLAAADKRIKISMLRKSQELPGYYFLDIHGKWSAEQLQALLPADCEVKWLGTFTACQDRHLYQDRFFAL